MISSELKLNSGAVVRRNGEEERTPHENPLCPHGGRRHVFSLSRVPDASHVGEDDVSVAVLQSLHELQVVADLETLDRLFL